ncbi:DUF4012 domain-containing protein [Microbacterium luticocti]|uniref:DUF4012 domain-containing protein n=1 Tax=Microbacterium luticocti TaxID=451764 RepID=UPI0012EB6D76|nr:DUF4012 domain-containing protein [Microbacterium luticocti]
MSVKDDLTAAKDQLSVIADEVKSGDAVKIQTAGQKILDLTRRADDTVKNPLWEVASGVPLVGQNVDAVRRATEATRILVDGALPAGIKLLSTLQLDKVSVSGGGMDITPIREASDSLPKINEAFKTAQSKLDGVDRSKLLPAVDDAISSLFDVMEQAGPLLQNVQHYLPTLLDLAGADSKRTYMLIFQNNAEVRSGGGLPAATAIVNVDNGKAKLADQTGTYSFPRDRIVLDVPPETASLYEPDTFMGFGNFSRTPDFPTTAKAFDGLWHNVSGKHLDGVISLDPVVLSYMLKVTGPIKTADGRDLTSKNVVETLLYDAYIRYPVNAVQDAFFADVAARVFDKISSGKWDVMKMLDQLELAVKEQRLHVWFPRAAEQSMAVELGLDGALATDNTKATEVGIFVNDAAYSKLEFFMKNNVSVTCDPTARTVTTSITVANSAPLEGMTKYQLGIRNKRYGIPRNSFILDTIFFAPPGGEITAVDPQGGDSPYDRRVGIEQGRNAESIRVFVPSGSTRTISFTSTLPAGGLGPLSVRFSPTVTTTPVTIAPSCGSLFAAK